MTPNIKHARSNDQVDQDSGRESEGSKSSMNRESVAASSISSANAAPARCRPRLSLTLRTSRNSPKPLQSYIPANLRSYVVPYHGDFCVSPHFNPNLIAQLMVEGFLPIATEGYLLPKLHQQRCVIHLPNDLHVSKSARKKAKRYQLTFNQSFHEVVDGCRQQHGQNCWLYPPLVEAFSNIQDRQPQGMLTQVTESSSRHTSTCPVRLYSVELWDTDGTLVAGELGYTVGSIYTSLTGFSRQDSAGSVQMAALGRCLCQAGFTLWDLGMDMEYKRALGSELMPRDDFVQFVQNVRTAEAHRTLPRLDRHPSEGSPQNCRDIIDGVSQSAAATTTTTTRSVS
jgi:Leu/Phe-tRNA-protein transferase